MIQGTFWRVAGLAQQSPVEAILDREEFTLEELLEEEDLIQECKSLNSRLVTYLRREDVVDQLLTYLFQPPTEQQNLKYPYVACEVFCCDVDAVYGTMLEKPKLLDKLFAFLSAPRPLDALTAGYFSRVVACLLARRPQELGAYLCDRRQEALARMCEHVETPSVAELLKKLYGADPEGGGMGGGMGMCLGGMGGMGMMGGAGGNGGGASDVTSWIADSDVLPALVKATCGSQGDAASRGAADVVVSVARNAPPYLRAALLGDKTITEQLVACAVEGALDDDPASSAAAVAPRCALDVCAAMCLPSEMDRRAADNTLPHSQGSMNFDNLGGGFFGGGGGFLGSGGMGVDDDDEPGGPDGAGGDGSDIEARRVVARLIAARATELAAFLQTNDAPANPPEPLDVDELDGDDPIGARQRFLPVAHGYLLPPLGARRLGVARLFSAIARSGDCESMRVLAKEGVCQKLMALCIRYPFHSALHHEAYAVANLMLGAALDPALALTQAAPASPAHDGDGENDDGAAAAAAAAAECREIADLCLRSVLEEPCALATCLASAPPTVGGGERAPGEALFCLRKIRAGYMGHFIKLSNRLVELTSEGGSALESSFARSRGKRDPPTPEETAEEEAREASKAWARDVLASNTAWTSYLDDDLARYNADADVNSWQCGRPARMGSNSLSGDEDDSMSSMFGSGMAGMHAALGGMGDLASSLDDEDDEDEDEDEDDEDEEEDDDDEDDDEDEDEDDDVMEDESVGMSGDKDVPSLGLSLDASIAAGASNRYGDTSGSTGGNVSTSLESLDNSSASAFDTDDFNPRAQVPLENGSDADASLSEISGRLSNTHISSESGKSSSSPDADSSEGDHDFDAFQYWRCDLKVEIPDDA
ncbi:hypothetical protein PPROV_000351500 [Pycnococcus provasolii]|uniref:Uncharacterized protein n=2 Tax=Pycnococcus provasolii TaxID=41880 RepID=A0A830HDL5_9CHLO|nr:hypothetical protein PPROV_000351500 [Pycnococcus provasolii]